MTKAVLVLNEMPRNCRNCRFAYEPWLKDEMICDIAHRNFNKTDSDKRQQYCPLKSLPKGHGRLIDAERLKEVFRRNTGHDYHELIDIAPTIIEADKGGRIMTVKELLKACEEQIAKGNGDKQIVISNDDEGNGYHDLWYAFTDDLDEIKEIREYTYVCDDDELNNIIILG